MIGIHYIPGTYARWESSSLHLLGDVMVGLGIGMVPCLIFAMLNNEPLLTFILPIVICFAVALILIPLFKLPSIIKPVDGLFMIGMAWLVSFIIGSIPFLLSGMNVFDSIFESASGLTTTGATIMVDIESWPSGILLWRSMMQWIGGIAIIFLFLFVMPMIGFGGRAMFGNEVQGSGSRNFTVKMRDAAKQFLLIYGALTIILIFILLVLGTNIFDSLCIAFSTISTGGFMCKNDSLMGYENAIKVVVMIFMFLGGTNFYLHFKGLYQKKPKNYLKNEEFVIMLLWYLLASLLIYIILYGESIVINDEFVDNIVNILFNVVSAGTTTGFVSYDYESWLPAAVALLFVMTVIGGSTGSTSGGIKIGRIIVVMRYASNVLNQMLHPKGIYDVKLNGSSVDNESLSSAVIVMLLFIVTVITSSVLLMLCGTAFEDAITRVIGCITSFGPAINECGPLGSFQYMEWYTKLFLSFIMWLGRLEILTALIILTPGFWKEFLMSKKKVLSRMSEKYNRGIKR